MIVDRANLNESYFTNRQDRYIHFHHPSLATYCQEFLQASSAFTYRLAPDPSSPEGYRTHWDQTAVHPQDMEPLAQTELSKFQARWKIRSREAISEPRRGSVSASVGEDTLVMPIIQGGQFGIREEEDALASLLNGLSQHATNSSSTSTAYNGPLIDFTTGYFGIYNDYCKLILQSSLRYRIICSSPKVCIIHRHYQLYTLFTLIQANGFHGSKGVSGRLPEGYTFLEQRFMRQVRQAGLEWLHDDDTRLDGPGVQLNEWEREGWTYHAKGTVSTFLFIALFDSRPRPRYLDAPESKCRSLPYAIWVD